MVNQQVHLLYTDGTLVDVKPRSGTTFALKELQNIVGGSIEVVYLADGRLMILNEGRKYIARLARNDEATKYLQEAGGVRGDWIAGDVVICPASMIE